MKCSLALFALLTLLGTGSAFAQEAVRGNPDHEALLASSDPKLAANKRLVYDFWREVFEAGHVELAPKYMTETYIQHNPLVASGRDAIHRLPHEVRAAEADRAEGQVAARRNPRRGRPRRVRLRTRARGSQGQDAEVHDDAGSTCGASRTARWRSTGTPRRSSDSGGKPRVDPASAGSGDETDLALMTNRENPDLAARHDEAIHRDITGFTI